jgi:2-polyprenyl-3-methyl-5-hydroxy-6-metoxy-1,4-benzoquinol methylase
VSARPEADRLDPSLVGASERGGNVYDKYGSKNPIERRLVGGFLSAFDELAARTGASDAHEVGCGEGELSRRLARRGIGVRGSDAFEGVIGTARERAAAEGLEIGFEARAVQELEPERDGAELIVCCEVLEHLEEPDAALERLAALARPWLLVSVPREPLWRALNLLRLSYVSMLGNTPGHVNHWSRRGFLRWLGDRVEVVEARTPLPWTIALCRTG